MSERRIIGYAPIYAPEPGSIVTQAFILCSRCRGAVSTTGGPRDGALCLECVRDMKNALADRLSSK